ncbi:Coiled-coil and C2 domain-containing protein 1B [Actinomortierella wolfii]|nr:Coiled-coil and C2 domain-containing protein 1B [Actinomortierella wolfii]
MFSWKKDPSQIRRPSPSANVDYADLISQGLRLANEELPEGGEGDYLDDDGNEDEGDIDLNDPDLLDELQKLTGEAPAPKPKASAAATAAKTPASTSTATTGASTKADKNAPVTQAAASKGPSNPILADLGLSEADFEDNDDSEVELTEEDMKNPLFLAQLKSLGGVDEDTFDNNDNNNSASVPAKIPAESMQQDSHASPQKQPQEHQQQMQSDQTSLKQERLDSDNYSLHRPGSTSSSLIAIPPRDRPYEYEDDDMASVTDVPVEKPPVVNEPPKQNREQLLTLLKTRVTQYKRSALDCKRAGDMASAAERVKTFKKLQEWITLVEAGGFLDPDLYIIPNEPPAMSTPSSAPSNSVVTTRAPSTTPPSSSSRQEEASTSSMPGQLKSGPPPSSPPTSKAYEPPLATPSLVATTQVSMELAEATADDVRHEHTNRRTVKGGIEFRALAKDDDFQIVSNNDDDTYDMLQSQLESQIEMCKTVKKYYFQNADKMTALKFHKLQSVFEADLVSLKSYRQHGKKAPAFHFQDVRFEVEVGYNPDIALNELVLTIKRGWDLSHKEVAPSSITSYVDWNLGWPTENMPGAGTGKGYTSTIKQTSSPEYQFTHKIGIERTRAFLSFVQRRKATFEVWHYRGMFRKSLFLGRAQLPLQHLLNHSEIHEILPLVDQNGRKPVGGKIEVEIKLQRPLLKPEIAVKEEKWLVIDEFNSNGIGLPILGSSTKAVSSSPSTSQGRTASPASASAGTFTKPGAPASASPRPVSSPAVVSPKPAQPTQPATPKSSTPSSTTSARVPATGDVRQAMEDAEEIGAGAADDEVTKAKEELDSVDHLVSNNVLESEIETAKQRLQVAKAAGKAEEADEYQDRLMQLEIKMQLLVVQVQSGALTMDMYCQKVKARIEKDKALALFFKKRQMLPEAKTALTRLKIMQAEMKEVDDALAAEAAGEAEGDE